MKKRNTLLLALLPIAGMCMANEGLSQLSGLSPASGVINLDFHPSGVTSMTFNFTQDAVINRDAQGYIELYRNGEVFSRVVAFNPVQLSYDNIFAQCFQLSFFLQQSKAATEPAQYQVRIPEGFFLVGEDRTPNSPIEIDYTIEPPLFSFSPAPGKYEELYRFVCTIPEAVSVELDRKVDGTPRLVCITDDEAKPMPLLVTAKDNKVTFTLLNVASRPGTWELEIPEGYIKATMADGSVETSGEKWGALYQIPDWSYGIPELSIGSVTDFLPGTIRLTLPDYDVNIVNSVAGNFVYPVNEDGSLGTAVLRYQAFKNSTDPHVVELRCMNGAKIDNYIAPGSYRLVTAEKLFNVKGNDKFCSSMSFDFNVTEPTDPPYNFGPDDGASPYSVYRLSADFPGAQEVTLNNQNICWLSNATVNFPFYPSVSDSNIVVFTPVREVTLPGDYVFTSATGCISADGINYVVSGKVTILEDPTELPSLLAPDAPRTVYGLNGTVILKEASDEELKALPAGVYVIGGKTVMIR